MQKQRQSCPIAHGVIEQRRNAYGSVTFECMFCHLSTTLRSNARTESERNRDMEARAAAFFKARQ